MALYEGVAQRLPELNCREGRRALLGTDIEALEIPGVPTVWDLVRSSSRRRSGLRPSLTSTGLGALSHHARVVNLRVDAGHVAFDSAGRRVRTRAEC